MSVDFCLNHVAATSEGFLTERYEEQGGFANTGIGLTLAVWTESPLPHVQIQLTHVE